MLEESRMDKKSMNRSSLPQSRASAIDCKKSSELTHNKPWPRNNKKREGTGCTPKNEAYRKNVPAQRGRGPVDRRPRTRGPNGYPVGGAQNTGIDNEDEPEIGSVFVPGSKKQNLNHLLNFMYPSRGALDRRGPAPRRHNYVHHKHEHDLYLRAYCQFVVKENGDYKANLLDPDTPVKWEEVEEVVVRGNSRSECPICLGAPVAGRVGPCGHVYCWPCALHYAAAHDRQPPPCPVCTTPLHVNDMKPTRIVQWEQPAEEVSMRLVRRLRGSTTVEVAPPRGQVVEVTPYILGLDRIHDAPYCKLFAANQQQIQDILEREKKEIEAQILAEIDTTEIVFMEQALDMLNQKMEQNKLHFIEPAIVDHQKEDVPITVEKQEINGNKMDWFDVDEQGAAAIEVIQNQLEDLTIASNLNPDVPEFNPEAFEYKQANVCNNETEFPLMEAEPLDVETLDNDLTDIDKLNQAKYFYFYQAADGQQVFLSSLNVRVLVGSWGALSAAPPLVRARVLHRDTLPLTEQTRKHMPCAAHLPLHCSFDIVEMDLQPPYVTKEALRNFSDELERRARARARQERHERRRERAHRRATEGPPRPDFTSELVFPAPTYTSPPSSYCGPPSSYCDPPASYCDPPASYCGPPASNSRPTSGQSQADVQESSPSTSVGSPPSGLSFAKMASTSGTWRVRAAPPPPPPAAAAEEAACEGGAPRPLSLSDAIEAALLAAPAPSAKKNKKKQKILFATAMQRAP